MVDFQLPAATAIPAAFQAAVRAVWLADPAAPLPPETEYRYLSQLLWQRGVRDLAALPGYLDADRYQPTGPAAFGREMERAVARILHAREQQERVAIWGDFDADGITATSVLWEGLGQFLAPTHLSYYIPDRLTESHGLNLAGIERLHQQGVTLIVTCDTGSTHGAEIAAAQDLGIDPIVTDHHTLPPERPPAVATINPRSLPIDHPLYHLAGVAVAYKLIEALYAALPAVPQQPLTYLLDLVAIGLVADLVQLSGDCRYLAQIGIQRLQQQNTKKPDLPGYRPGVAKLLELCQRTGDRPMDISFGIAPRINAMSRIQGDARLGVQLLTGTDESRCHELAIEAELTNTRRKELQKNVGLAVEQRLAALDLSTTGVIVLADSNWSPGILGLVAGQIAQKYGKPTILLSTAVAPADDPAAPLLARGSARSVRNIDLYQLVQSQSHLLQSFGGHPLAAGLSLWAADLPLFTAAIDQQLWQTVGELPPPQLSIDLVVTVADLGQSLFRELKLLEPYGMGNPTPKLLVRNCLLQNAWNANIRDYKGHKIRYIKTELQITDNSTTNTFPGVWWGHYVAEVPDFPCDLAIELDYNSHHQRYEARLIELLPAVELSAVSATRSRPTVLDLRRGVTAGQLFEPLYLVRTCPRSWQELSDHYAQAVANQQQLALAYAAPAAPPPIDVLRQLIGIAKFLARTGNQVTFVQLQHKLDISMKATAAGLECLRAIGYVVSQLPDRQHWQIMAAAAPTLSDLTELPAVCDFLAIVAAESLLAQYFWAAPVQILQTNL